MTLTNEVRINWQVDPIELLDVATVAAGGDPKTVEHYAHEYHRSTWAGYLSNRPGQGLDTLAYVRWNPTPVTGHDEDEETEAPPALVVLTIDNPYGGTPDGREIQALQILPPVVAWLDAQGVPREAWWWQDETAGQYYSGTEDVAQLWTVQAGGRLPTPWTSRG